MKNATLAQKYAQGQQNGKTGNMFIEGDTIYSYGRHFPIATRLKEGVYFVTTRRYSPTTQRHTAHVRLALKGATLLYVSNPREPDREAQIAVNLKEIDGLTVKARRARTERTREHYKREIASLKEQNVLLKEVTA